MFHKHNYQAASSPTLKTLATCLICLWLAHLPAFADHIMYIKHKTGQGSTTTDLTALTGGGIATPFGAITAFTTTPNGQMHVYYVDSNAQHVHQLYYNNTSWSDSDLSASTGGPTAYAYGISGFSIGNLQYVFYVGTDLHVHELNYNNINWSDQDLTATVGGNLASPAPLVAFATKPNNQLHVYYQDTGNLHDTSCISTAVHGPTRTSRPRSGAPIATARGSQDLRPGTCNTFSARATVRIPATWT